jgi:PLP dependent protein
VSDIASNLVRVRDRIAAACVAAGREVDAVALLAVSKFHPALAVREALAAGQHAFGESRVQELAAKAQELASEPGLQWHLIGSLQTNKVRDVLSVPGLSFLHSLDRKKLAMELQRELAAREQRLNVLLQINASGEEQKHGCDLDAVPELLDYVQAQCPALQVSGLMAMGPLHGDARPAFDAVVAMRDALRQRSGRKLETLQLATLSLGMSGDLEAAIAAGSTMVRIGTAIFGER